ncbi:hypothetical protein HRbin39_01616 [bacterium HR39]|nr:hypothetical protein HRbin39_01616 [bacterium HR39]
MALAQRAGSGGTRPPAGGGALFRRAQREAGVRPARRHLDLLGLEARLLRLGGGRARLLRRDALDDGDAVRRAQLPPVVQHRPVLGLRHRRSRPGALLGRSRDGRGPPLHHRLRAAAAPRLLHPVHPRRPREPGRHHGPVGARGAAVQVRLGDRHQLLAPARRGRAALRRRPLLGPHELPQGGRPGGRRHQVGRHHPPRRQDGHRRHRSPRHREVHRLEGDRGAEGGRAGGRLAPSGEARQDHHGRLPRSGSSRRGPLRAGAQSEAEEGAARGAAGHAAGLHPAADRPLRPPGLHRHRDPGVGHRLGR